MALAPALGHPSWLRGTRYVSRFEAAFAEFCGVQHAIACCNGTAALHLALTALGIGPGDEVLVPTLTFVATANAVVQCGARPVFVDAEPATWNLDPALIEAKITARTKAIVVVHLYGHPVDMDPIVALARRQGLWVVEDAAQAYGAEYKGRKAGVLGHVAAFSFYGNKSITTGEGGMVTTNDTAVARRVRQLKDHGRDPRRHYWYPVLGYNYRMTNVAAAIGLAQLEKSAWHLARRREVTAWYREQLREVPWVVWQPEQAWARHAYWMFSIVLDESVALQRDEVIARLLQQGVETRPVFYPLHQLPPYQDSCLGESFPVAERVAERGISLPTWAGLTYEDVSYVCNCLTRGH
jgi:perosamine synthetase